MHIQQRIFTNGRWAAPTGADTRAQVALIFGSAARLDDPQTWADLAGWYPGARLVGCSTAGEVASAQVHDDGLVATAIELEHGHVVVAAVTLDEAADSAALGALLASRLPHPGLVHVLIVSEGLSINGSALVAGLVATLPAGVGVTGGLSGDGARFARTTVCLDGPSPTQQVVAIGLYGARLHVGCGSRGGWDPFGPERRITRSIGNVLYELDGEPALDLYKRYLAEHAAGLPATGLLFPLAIRGATGEPVVRTILAVDETARSLTFAGDVPTGHRARLMKANVERLVDGATSAAQVALEGTGTTSPDLAILISCVGRKLVLKQRVEEELEAVRDAFGPHTAMTGFYSYGEISPFSPSSPCELHNQTMTITTISER
ncbi:MAG: FIST C-terminal domain-containing protein [Deltaproteobacteria bacterium]|nr:FIST C-terminal domain-containing protein [Deltaproteobacteria bacterium]